MVLLLAQQRKMSLDQITPQPNLLHGGTKEVMFYVPGGVTLQRYYKEALELYLSHSTRQQSTILQSQNSKHNNVNFPPHLNDCNCSIANRKSPARRRLHRGAVLTV